MSSQADFILHNANVITMVPGQPRAGLVAIKGDRILWVGANEDVELFAGRLIDCQGKTVVPGFNDAHCHILSLASSLLNLDLSPPAAKSIADIKSAVQERARKTPPGTWITGAGYNEFYLAEKHHPTRWDLDEAAPHHPVRLIHRSWHACVLNSLALSLAGISRDTPDPPGGLIDREPETGEPNGLLLEMNAYIGEKVVPPMTEEELARGIRLANHLYLSQGITSLQDASASNDLSQWRTLHKLKERGELASRVSLMIGVASLDDLEEQGLTPGCGGDELRLGAIKIVLDETTGSLNPPQEVLNEQVLRAHRAGFQVALHVIEECPLEAAIIALENALARSPRADHRHRLEHCSVCPPRLMQRLKGLQVVVASQPPFIYYSGERYLAEVPQSQQPWLYRFRSFRWEGLRLAASSDSPVVPNNPLVGIYAAVTRKAERGQVVGAGERISPAQALAAYTIDAAYASFEEKVKGSVAPGKLADLVVLSGDPTVLPEEEIKDIQVEMTIIGGKIAWEA